MAKIYTTVQGDMWDAIAARECGSEKYTDRLMWLNRQYLDCFTFPAGIVLTLPEEEQIVNTSLPPWKRVSA